jgi:hypothetical protein
MTATEFYGGGGNLTGVGVDGIVSTANATAITIDSSENVGFGVVPESDWRSDVTGFQIGSGGSIFARNDSGETKVFVSENVKWTSSGNEYINNGYASLFRMDAGIHTFQVAPSGTANAVISFTTGFEVLNSGKARAPNGILFGSDTAAVNTLDDYEEGTFTATLGGSSTQGSGPTTTGYYTKIGNQVHISWTFTNVTVSGASGNVTVSGLPFTSISQATGAGGVTYKFHQNNIASYIKMNSSATECYHYNVQNDGGWGGNQIYNTSGLHWVASFTYRA